jgi:hypothetical protein
MRRLPFYAKNNRQATWARKMTMSLFWRLEKAISPNRFSAKFRRSVWKSGLFDEEWYASHNPDVVAAGVDPLDHFCQHGDRELRHPSIHFNSHFYSKLFQVDLSQIGPLEHLVSHRRPLLKKLEFFLSHQSELKAERDDYRLRYYALKAAFDRSVAEADIARRLFAQEMAKAKILVLSDD